MTLTDPRSPSRATGADPREGGGRRSGGRAASGVAQRVEQTLRPLVDGPLPVRLRAWDGSEAGPADAHARRAAQPAGPGPAAVAPGRARSCPGLRHR